MEQTKSIKYICSSERTFVLFDGENYYIKNFLKLNEDEKKCTEKEMCRKCTTIKDLNQFSKNKNGKYQKTCLECCKIEKVYRDTVLINKKSQNPRPVGRPKKNIQTRL